MSTSQPTLTQQAQKALLGVIASSDLPVGLRIKNGDMLTLGKEAGQLIAKIIQQDQQRTRTIAPERIPLTTLAQVIESGTRGKDLQSQLSSKPADSRMTEYEALKSAIQSSDISDHERIIKNHKRSVMYEAGILGKIYREPVADGYALYMVAQTRPGQVRLCTLPVYDAYTSSQIGQDSWVDTPQVQASIDSELNLDRNPASRRRP